LSSPAPFPMLKSPLDCSSPFLPRAPNKVHCSLKPTRTYHRLVVSLLLALTPFASSCRYNARQPPSRKTTPLVLS
jgi:hypothetical protein